MGITMPDERLRERAAEELPLAIVGRLDQSAAIYDANQIPLSLWAVSVNTRLDQPSDWTKHRAYL